MTYDMLTLPPVPLTPRMEPSHPGALATDAELCQHWQDLDAHYSTGPDSPLHHDSRCAIHRRHSCRTQCDSCHTADNCVPATRRYDELTLCEGCYRHAVVLDGPPPRLSYFED